MRKLSLLLVFMFILSNCKKDNTDPLPIIANIVGKWKIEANELNVNGVNIWTDVPDSTSYFLSFRFDGVILDNSDLPACCVPDKYYVNGVLFTVIPKEKLEVNPWCAFSLCSANDDPWKIVQSGNELIIGARKFSRE